MAVLPRRTVAGARCSRPAAVAPRMRAMLRCRLAVQPDRGSTFVAVGPGAGIILLSQSPCSSSREQPCIQYRWPVPLPTDPGAPRPGRIFTVAVSVS
jgi:hypothetical protein